MNKEFLDMLSNDDVQPIHVVYDPANSMIYWQTEPFVRDGQIIIRRVGEMKVTVEKAYNMVKEYEMTTGYGEDDDELDE